MVADSRQAGVDVDRRIPADAGFGAPEVEITPEMIEAGLDVLCRYNPEADDATRVVRNIIKASLAAAPRRK